MPGSLSRRVALRSGIVGFGAAALAMRQPAHAEDVADLDDGLTVISDDGRFTQWVSLIHAAGLDSAAAGRRPYTAFIPTDNAFTRYPFAVRNLLGQAGSPAHADPFPDVSRLVVVVRTHVVRGRHPLGEFSGKKVTLTSLVGTPIEIDATDAANTRVAWAFLGTGKGTATVGGAPLMAKNAIFYPLEQLVFNSFG